MNSALVRCVPSLASYSDSLTERRAALPPSSAVIRSRHTAVLLSLVSDRLVNSGVSRGLLPLIRASSGSTLLHGQSPMSDDVAQNHPAWTRAPPRQGDAQHLCQIPDIAAIFVIPCRQSPRLMAAIGADGHCSTQFRQHASVVFPRAQRCGRRRNMR
jgi:hypothetical protein